MSSNTRVSALKEASKRGFVLRFDPSGDRNRCFYRCIAKWLNEKEDTVVNLTQNYMLENQVVQVANQVCLE